MLLYFFLLPPTEKQQKKRKKISERKERKKNNQSRLSERWRRKIELSSFVEKLFLLKQFCQFDRDCCVNQVDVKSLMFLTLQKKIKKTNCDCKEILRITRKQVQGQF